jgi:hypothetical protein
MNFASVRIITDDVDHLVVLGDEVFMVCYIPQP